MSDIRHVLAERIRDRMSSLHDGITVVASRAGCSRRTLHAVLRAEVSIGITRVSALAVALESTAAHLLDESGRDSERDAFDPDQSSDIRVVLARNLLHWRAQRSFVNVQALANAAALSKSHLYMVVNAQCDTGIDQLARLAHALEVAPSRLVSERTRDP